jgi:adhesin HecA-like repeat protein
MERELRDAIWTGRLVDLRTGNATAEDPTNGAAWGAQRTVAVALLAELLTSAVEPRQPRALRLAGARITGELNRENDELVCPLFLDGCWLDSPINLAGGKIPTLVLSGCRIPGLNGKQLQTQGDLRLTATVIHGEVTLAGAHIGGNLELSGTTITNRSGGALLADALSIHENMLCDGFTAHGEVDLDGASISGFADFGGARLENPNDRAFHASTRAACR